MIIGAVRSNYCIVRGKGEAVVEIMSTVVLTRTQVIFLFSSEKVYFISDRFMVIWSLFLMSLKMIFQDFNSPSFLPSSLAIPS